tara:strand:- start:59 stop:541 length:483 start_codon:yes stop_codon:yes gene_type:complete
MPINIHGKEYVTVAERVQMLHESGVTEISLNTEILHDDEKSIVMKTTLEIDGNSYTGIAQEIKGSTNINKTSAYENCETSAVGRCLGFAGYGSVESIASADEVVNAVAQQKPEFATPNQVKYIKTLCEEKKIDSKKWDFDTLTKQEAGVIIETIIQGDKK